METNVPAGTERKTPAKILIKKRQQLSFRRWIIGKSGGGTIEKYVGTDIWSVRRWISDRMTEGMNWNNYGSLWHIDHIVPLRIFDLTKEEDLKICWHYKNMIPLLIEDNSAKEGNVFFSFILLNKIKGEDYFFNKLYERILPEIDTMNKYIMTYCNIT